MTSPQWLRDYREGRREQVWHELRQRGRSIRREPELAAEGHAAWLEERFGPVPMTLSSWWTGSPEEWRIKRNLARDLLPL